MASLGMVAVLGFGLSATAQHPGRAKKSAAGNPAQRGAMNGGRPQVPPPNRAAAQAQANLQRMMAQEQAKMQQRQMQILQHQQQQAMENHQKAMHAFNAWQQQQGKSAGSANIPSTPAGFQKWAHAQQQKKAHKQSYDPAFDDYQQYQAGQKSARSASQAAQTQKKAASKAHAATAAKPVPTTASARLPSAQDQPMIGLLRTIHANLDRADATYDGNRIAAMGHIHNALRHLGSSVLSPGDSDFGAGHMPQSESDAILKGASAGLDRVAAQLSSHPAAEHHTRALREVHDAIRRLHTALQIN